MLDIILFLLGFIGIIIATYSDIKTTEIPDLLSYSLIISGFAIHILNANSLEYLKPVIVNFIIFLIIANFMYYTKQWGGGDAKLLIGLSIIFSHYPTFLKNYFMPSILYSFPITIFINILLVGAIYSLIWAIYLSLKNKEKFLEEFKKFIRHTKRTQLIILCLSLLIFTISLLLPSLLKPVFFTIAVSPLILLYFWMFIKTVENVCMYKKIPVSKLREGDWVINNIKYKNKYIYKKNYSGISKEQIKLLKKTNIKRILIKEGIVFTPSFLIGFIISTIYGIPITLF